MGSKKKLIGLAIAGILTVLGLSQSNGKIEVVNAQSQAKPTLTSVNKSIENIIRSLKTNYLGVKNVSQWNSDIKRVRAQNNSLSNDLSYSKRRNNETLDKAQSLVNAAAQVNQVENSMSVNSLSMKNVKQWDYYLNNARKNLKEVDLTTFKSQHSELVKRADKKKAEIDSIKKSYYDRYDKIEDMYFDAIALEDKDKEEALRRSKAVKSLALNLQTHETKTFLIERIEGLISRLDDDIVSKANEVYTEKTISSESDIKDLSNKKYNHVEISTWNDFKDKTISHLKANTLIVKSGSNLVLNNCNIGRLIIEDNNSNLEVVLQGESSIERAVAGSGVTFSRREDFMESSKDPMEASMKTIEVNTEKMVKVNTQVTYISVGKRDSFIDIDSYVGTVKLNASYGNILISKNGIVENMYVNPLATFTLLEGTGKIVDYYNNSVGTIMLMKNPPVGESSTGISKERLEKAAELALEEAKKTRDKKDIERARRLIDHMESGSKKDSMKKELDKIS